MSLDEAAAHPREGKLRVLSLDGGGIRGLSSLLVLDALMKQIDPISPPKPCEVFDLIGGTSTGGLIAIMLGRLNMDMASCIRAYRDMSDSIFKPKETLNIAAKILAKYHAKERFSSSALEKAIKTVIVSTGRSVEDMMYPGIEQKCKIFVCAVSRECPGSVVRFRNYRPTLPAPLNPQIWEAARATSAATSFFDPIAIGPFGQEFLDGATGANNPVEIVLEEARDIWPNARERLQYIISIGTGEPSLAAFGDNLLSIGKTLVRIATDANAVAAQFARSHPELVAGTDQSRHIYQRFNVRKGLETVKLQETEKIKEIASATHLYLDEDEQRARLRAFGTALQVEEDQHRQTSSENIHFRFDGVRTEGGAPHGGTHHADTTIKEIYEKYLFRHCVGIGLPGVEGMIPYVTSRIHATVTSGPCSYDVDNPLINENVPIHMYFNRLLKWTPPAMNIQVGSFYRGWKTVLVNDDLSIRFVRTVRLPESKDPQRLPMGFGTLPIFEMSELQKSIGTLDSLPEHIRDKGGLIMPMYQNEAMFLSFESKRGTYAIRTFLGGVNAISGNTFVPNMATTIRQLNKTERRQDYVLVTPDKQTSQRWLDGARTGRGVVRQFTAVCGTSELSVEHQVTGTNSVGGLQFEIIPQHESCHDEFWSSVFDQQKVSVPFLATARDVGLVAGCRVYATTGSRRMVTLRDILHDSQTIKILASKRTPSCPDPTLDSEASLILKPFGKLRNSLCVTVWAGYNVPTSKVTSLKESSSGDDHFKFFLCLPRDKERQHLREWAVCLAGLRQGSLVHMGRLIGHGNNAVTIEEGDYVEIHQEQVGGGTGPGGEIDLAIGAGAKITQAIVPDTSDPRVWDVKRGVLFNVQLLDSTSFRRCTGLSPPLPPIAFRTYIKRKYPFLSLEEQDDIPTPVKLGHLKSVPEAGISESGATTSTPLCSSSPASLPPGYCHSCEQVYARANQYIPCGHTMCQKCEDGTDYDFDPEYVRVREVYGGGGGRGSKWTCCICGSKECELVGNVHNVQPQEEDEMCEKFRSVLDLGGDKTTWAYDCFEREDGGLGPEGGIANV